MTRGLLCVLLALAVMACGDDNQVATATSRAGAAATGAPTSSVAGPASPTTAGGAVQKPAVEIPDTPPPTTLEVKDITVGSGAEAASGKTVRVHYVGVSYSTKKEFDASYNRGQPFSFALGAGRVIQGWDQGVAGMKVGGRRQLTIPPDLGYGARGAPPDIGPNETLVFVIDLLEVQ